MKGMKTEIRFFSIPEWKKKNISGSSTKMAGNLSELISLPYIILKNVNRETSFTSWTIILKVLIRRGNISKCSRIADGNIYRISLATVIFVRQSLKWMERKRYSVTMLPGWI